MIPLRHIPPEEWTAYAVEHELSEEVPTPRLKELEEVPDNGVTIDEWVAECRFHAKYEYAKRKDPDERTKELPGTDAKIEVMAARVKAKRHPHHPNDTIVHNPIYDMEADRGGFTPVQTEVEVNGKKKKHMAVKNGRNHTRVLSVSEGVCTRCGEFYRLKRGEEHLCRDRRKEPCVLTLN